MRPHLGLPLHKGGSLPPPHCRSAPRSVKKTCQWHVFSVGRRSYAPRKGQCVREDGPMRASGPTRTRGGFGAGALKGPLLCVGADLCVGPPYPTAPSNMRHCEERSDVAIRIPKAFSWRRRWPSAARSDEVAPYTGAPLHALRIRERKAEPGQRVKARTRRDRV